MSLFFYLLADIVLAVTTAPWLVPLVGVYLAATVAAVWACRQWRP